MSAFTDFFKKASKPSSDKLGSEPVKTLLLSMAIPSVVAMLMQSFYNIIDSVFVARISEGSFAAVTLAFPVQMIIGALSTGIGVGINSSISRSLGSGDKETAGKAAANGLLLGFVTVAIMMLFGIFGAEPFIRLYTDDPEVIEAGTIYIRTISMLAFGQIFTQISFSIMQGSGNMILPMMSQLAGGASVIILDPILIFGCGLGVLGAAIASSMAQAISMCIGLYGVFRSNRENLPVSFRNFKPDLEILKDILAVGIPAALTQATTSIVGGIMNKLIAGYGTAAVAAYGGYSKVASFGTLPIFGVTRGMNPILGYSVGAKDRQRFIETRTLAMKLASISAVAAALLFTLAPGLVLNMLNASEEVRAIGMISYRIMGAPMALYGVSIVLTQQFPPAKKSYISLTLTLMRQVGYMIPLCMLFSKLWGINGLWSGYAAADVLNFVVVVCVNRWFTKNVLGKWDLPEVNEAEEAE